MKVVGNILRGNFTADITGIPAPVVNVTTNASRSDRVEALYAALAYHRDHQDDTVPDAEEVCNTAMAFEYFLKNGEYPSG